jgi:hypothetical protein
MSANTDYEVFRKVASHYEARSAEAIQTGGQPP